MLEVIVHDYFAFHKFYFRSDEIIKGEKSKLSYNPEHYSFGKPFFILGKKAS